MTDAQREAALRSALGRLPVAVFVVDGARLLRPINQKASSLMDSEGIRGDLVEARPHHPLAELIRGIVAGTNGEIPTRTVIAFPSGARYTVEPSRRSEKGLERWLILLIDEVHETATVPVETILDQWELTDREKCAALLMARGLRSEEICAEMQIAPTTLKSHVKKVLAKSGSRSRAEFLAKVLQRSSS